MNHNMTTRRQTKAASTAIVADPDMTTTPVAIHGSTEQTKAASTAITAPLFRTCSPERALMDADTDNVCLSVASQGCPNLQAAIHGSAKSTVYAPTVHQKPDYG